MTRFLCLGVLASSFCLVAGCGGIATTTSSGSSGSSGGGVDNGSSGGSNTSGGTTSGSSGTSGTSGTSGGTTTGHIDPTPFPATCSKGLAGLNPPGAFDAIEIRVTAEPLDNDASAPFTVQETRGTPCALAKDKPTCKAAFDAATVTTSDWSTNANYKGGVAPPPARYAFYVITQADAVRVIAKTADLVAFIAQIDSPTEAIQLRNGPLGGTSDCPRIRTDADGYSFLDEGCNPYMGSTYTKNETVTKVARNGSIAITLTAGPFPDPTYSCTPLL